MTITSASSTGRTDDVSAEAYPQHAPVRAQRRRSTETKSSFKTTELIVYVAAVIGVLAASYLVKTTAGHTDFFRADKAWFYIVLLTIGYMGSRGLAKSGSREHYDA
jgi:hypothetical protein